MNRPPWTRALFGHELQGFIPVRYVYLDEAGTAAHEPLTVEAGIIIKPDAVWKAVEDRMADLIRTHVPEEYRDGFVFHAKDLFGGGKYKNGWDLAGRLALLEAFAAIPGDFELPLCVGTARRGAMLEAVGPVEGRKASMKPEEMDHCLAFLCCISAADTYLREDTPHDEIAHLAVEDCDRMRRFLDRVYERVKNDPRTLELGVHYENIREDGKPPRAVAKLSVSKIMDGPHFVTKARSPMLQLADMCAFVFRRHLSGQSHSERLIEALLRIPAIARETFQCPSSMAIYRPAKKRGLSMARKITGGIGYF